MDYCFVFFCFVVVVVVVVVAAAAAAAAALRLLFFSLHTLFIKIVKGLKWQPGKDFKEKKERSLQVEQQPQLQN